MAPGPSWLSSWVKSNNKHVVISTGSNEKNKAAKDATSTASTADSSYAGKVYQRAEPDPESSAVRTVNNRRRRRRLQKTRSATDLIRELAQAGRVANADSVKNSSKFSTNDDTSVTTTDPLSPSESSDTLRLVAGLFGASLDKDDSVRQEKLPAQQQQIPKYLNDVAFIQQLEQKSLPLQQQRKQTHNAESSLVLERSAVTPRKSNEESLASNRGYDSPQHSRGLVNLAFLPQPFFAKAGAEEQHASHLQSLDSQLVAALDDLEYMRGVALKNDQASDETVAEKTVVSRGRETPSASSAEASKQLNEVIFRHKKQVEQLTRERCRWQQDIHFKLSKFANLCKDLNEESADRNEEAVALKDELEAVKTERDTMAEELSLLRAQVRGQQTQRAEYAEMKKKLTEYENRGLDRADDAIRSRDRMISDLSSKLEQSLDLMELEREQQRQRRQIIFPAVRSSSS